MSFFVSHRLPIAEASKAQGFEVTIGYGELGGADPKLLEQQAEGTSIRVFVVNPGTASAECGVSYCPADAIEPEDIELKFEHFSFVLV